MAHLALPPSGAADRKRFGEYGWVRLNNEEYECLLSEMGEHELTRCIQYVDESAQKTGNKNKWKDWNLVIRDCHRNGWGRHSGGTRQSSSTEAMDALKQIRQMFGEEESQQQASTHSPLDYELYESGL